MTNTIDQSEIETFSKTSAHWWNPTGPHAPLHKLNPTRLRYIRDQIATHFGKDPTKNLPLKDLSILDVGCGGGLLCEPLARLGANMTGLDADTQAIETAKNHANGAGLTIRYANHAIESFQDEKFDVVMVVEIVEHVSDLPAFLKLCTNLLKENAVLIFSTLNRTKLSYLLGIVAAEKILRWVPEGTHDWEKFVTPSEMESYLEACQMKIRNLQGMSYDITKDWWILTNSLSVNYIGVATKA